MSVIAKGARQSKSKYQGILESINLIEVVVFVSATRKLQILGEISLEDSFRTIRVNFDKTGYAFALLELIDIFFKEGSADTVFFDFLKALLSEIEKMTNPRIVFWYFLIKLSSYLGFKPEFNACSTCNKSLVSEEVVFSIQECAVICRNCGLSPESGWKLSIKARKSLSDLQNLPHKKLSSVEISLDDNFAFTDFLLTYLRFHSDEKLNLSSLKLFK